MSGINLNLPSINRQFEPALFKSAILTWNIRIPAKPNTVSTSRSRNRKHVAVKASSDAGESRRSFLSVEEAGLVEISGLSSHERFLCRLTISSLNLLRVIAEQEKCGIEELNAGRICDWFLKDKLKREQNFDSAVLQWDDSEFFL